MSSVLLPVTRVNYKHHHGILLLGEQEYQIPQHYDEHRIFSDYLEVFYRFVRWLQLTDVACILTFEPPHLDNWENTLFKEV